jgi:hypothetical protein
MKIFTWTKRLFLTLSFLALIATMHSPVVPA